MKGELITITREDAENILWMLDEAIRRLHGCLETDACIAVFGNERSISYERLIDKLEPIYADLACTKLMNPEIEVHQVTAEVINKVIDSVTAQGKYGAPYELMYFYDEKDNKYIGCDNTTGDAWVEDFDTYEECVNWLLGKED